MKDIVGEKRGTDRLINCMPNSINAYLHRCCEHLQMKDILSARSGFHAMRKYSIRTWYQQKLEEYGPKTARELSMVRLGHSTNRSDLCHVYLGI